MTLQKIILLIGSLISANALAGGIRLGTPSYGGNGCPGGSVSAVLSPGEESLSILFDSFIAEAGETTGRSLDRKSCNVVIPVTVPQGYSVSLIQADYRGFNFIPSGGRIRFDAEYFWAGIRGPRITRTFMGPAADNFTVTDKLLASAVVWSSCGASVNLRINANMMAITNRFQEQTIAQIDSADISSGLVYHVAWRRCN